jgi:hypothetical protein
MVGAWDSCRRGAHLMDGALVVKADVGTRTRDPLLTMEVLYQLSYVGAKHES